MSATATTTPLPYTVGVHPYVDPEDPRNQKQIIFSLPAGALRAAGHTYSDHPVMVDLIEDAMGVSYSLEGTQTDHASVSQKVLGSSGPSLMWVTDDRFIGLHTTPYFDPCTKCNRLGGEIVHPVVQEGLVTGLQVAPCDGDTN